MVRRFRLWAAAVALATLSVVGAEAAPASAAPVAPAVWDGGCAQEVYTRACISLQGDWFVVDAYQLSMAGYPSNTWINIYVEKCDFSGTFPCEGCPPNYRLDCSVGGPVHSGFLRDSTYFGPYVDYARGYVLGKTVVELSYPNGPVYQWFESPAQHGSWPGFGCCHLTELHLASLAAWVVIALIVVLAVRVMT
jgi:hypothetical protein